MNIEFVKSKLKAGDVFKSRKTLCEQLNEPYTNQTNTKNSQDKTWHQFFDFEKIEGTQQIKITEIYEHKKIDFSSKGSPMPEHLDPAVLFCISQKHRECNDKCYITLSSLAESVGICTQYVTKFYSSDDIYYELKKKYSSSSNDKAKESKLFKIMAGYVQKASSSYKSMIRGSLNRLEIKHFLIKAEKVILIKNESLNYRICRLIEQEKYEDIKKLVIPPIYDKIYDNIISKDEKVEPYFKEGVLHQIGISDDEYREASNEEENFIEKVKTDVLKSLNYESMQELYFDNARNPAKIKKYRNECNKRCLEFNIDYFEAYRIDWCNNEKVSHQNINLDGLIKVVNKKFIEHFSKSTKTKSEENINKNYEEKLLKHNEHGLGKMREERAREMQGINKNIDTFISDFLRI